MLLFRIATPVSVPIVSNYENKVQPQTCSGKIGTSSKLLSSDALMDSRDPPPKIT